MKTQQSALDRTRAILLLIGSFTFAFLLGEAVHELGHYLAHRAYGNADIWIHLDPFGGSRIVSAAALPRESLGPTSAAGPLFNLALAVSCFLILWRWRAPALIPLLLWGPVALVQEGVGFTLGLLTPDGDGQWIIAWGVPGILVLALGLASLFAAIMTVSWLLPLASLGQDEPPGIIFAVLTTGISALMLVRAAHSILVSPNAATENLIPLIFSLLLTTMVLTLRRPLTSILGQPPKPCSATWPVTVCSISLGAGMFLLQTLI